MAYDDNNIFAKIIRGEASAHKVFEDEQTLAFLDLMPQSEGHTLILPKVAAENIFDLEPEPVAAVMATAKTVSRGIMAAFEPDGIRLMQFNDAAAGQTVFHFHMHIIPCYEGLPLGRHGRGMADSKVLEEQAERLRAALKKLQE